MQLFLSTYKRLLLRALKDHVEERVQDRFNFVLFVSAFSAIMDADFTYRVNYYADGKDSISWHCLHLALLLGAD